MKKMNEKLKDSGLTQQKIEIDKAIKYYEEGKKVEWQRLSSTQTP